MTGPDDPGRTTSPEVMAVLERAQGQGLIGPGALGEHLEHARGFATAVPEAPALAVDLGTGGGLPGLVLAECWPESRWWLVDGSERRAAFLDRAVDDLGWRDRLEVVAARAEVLGHDPARRARADLVVARSFGPPAVTAECAAPLLRVGGLLVVSEPPASDGRRWAPDGLDRVGLGFEAVVGDAPRFARLRQRSACPATYPRRTGVPAKRPLF